MKGWVQGFKGNKVRCGGFSSYTVEPRKRRQGPGPRWALVLWATAFEVGQAGVWQSD